jgi:hypothetical protein
LFAWLSFQDLQPVLAVAVTDAIDLDGSADTDFVVSILSQNMSWIQREVTMLLLGTPATRDWGIVDGTQGFMEEVTKSSIWSFHNRDGKETFWCWFGRSSAGVGVWSLLLCSHSHHE